MSELSEGSLLAITVYAWCRILKLQIKALPPIPKSVPALGRVVDVIEQERGKLTSAEIVQLLLQSLSHHSLSVRAAALEVGTLHTSKLEPAPFRLEKAEWICGCACLEASHQFFIFWIRSSQLPK